MAGTRRSGRKPKPTRSKALTGNPGHRSLNADEPLVTALTHADAPSWLNKVAKAAWKFYAPQLIASRVLTAIDLHNLEAFCVAYSRWRKAESMLARNGLTCVGAGGGLMKHPAATVVNEALRQMTSYGAALGLSPADRSRIKVPGGSSSNPFKDL